MVQTRAERIGLWVLFTIMAALTLIWLAPVLYMASTAFKPEAETIIVRWIPETFTLENFREITLNTRDTPVMRWFYNSLVIATAHTVLALTVTSMSAYAFGRLEFPGRNALFSLLMATMMIPGVINFVPNYLIVDKLGWVDTHWAMILPGLGGVFGVFLLRQFFKTIPKELEEAATIDGAGPFQTFFRIILPLAKPALITLGVFTFMGNWNDFLWPLIVTNEPKMRTLPPGLATFQGKYVSYYGKLMAGALMSTAPVLVMFAFAQRFFVRGITLTGLKG